MDEEKRIRTLEGLGYCAALMIVASVIGNNEVLKYFYYCGLALGLIVVVRLVALKSRAQSQSRDNIPPHTFGPSKDQGDEVTR
jgi:hypothetical protein